ncbi:MAG: ROK family transcriptional regulator [Propionibacterium sp.]|nr:ROK family transcriptional regulator [Propionibacterium sp.]
MVFDVLRGAGAPQRVSELSKGTGLTAASLGQVLRGLAAKGWVTSVESVEQRRGRPAQVYSLRRQPGAVLGLDVGVHAVRAVRMTLDGETLVRAETRFEQGSSGQERVDIVEQLVGEVLFGVEDEPVWLSGLALKRDAESEKLGEAIEARLPSRCKLVTDVNADTWAEHIEGGAKGHDDVLLVHLGWQPWLGLLLDGQPRGGAHGAAGDLPWDSLLPGVEQMEWPDRLLKERDGWIYDIVAAAKDGDEDAVAATTQYMRAVLPAVVFATAIVDPKVVVLGGAFSPVAHLGVDLVVEALGKRMGDPPQVVKSGLDQYSSALGAAHLARQEVLAAVVSPTEGVLPISDMPDDFFTLPQEDDQSA